LSRRQHTARRDFNGRRNSNGDGKGDDDDADDNSVPFFANLRAELTALRLKYEPKKDKKERDTNKRKRRQKLVSYRQ
jgi:hypothetical protein